MSKAQAYPELYPILKVFQFTGMRPGELRALTWDNIDFEKNTIKITHATTIEYSEQQIGKKPKKKEVIGPTKSAYSVREIPIPPEVIGSIVTWREYINTNNCYKYASESKFLFCSKRTGSFILDDALRKMFSSFLENEELDGKKYTLYRFRHSVCTNLIKKGVAIPTVQRFLGDNTTDVILKIYSHVNDEDKKDAMKKLEDSFTKK